MSKKWPNAWSFGIGLLVGSLLVYAGLLAVYGPPGTWTTDRVTPTPRPLVQIEESAVSPQTLEALAQCLLIKDWQKSAALAWFAKGLQGEGASGGTRPELSCRVVDQLRADTEAFESQSQRMDGGVFREMSDEAGLTGWYALHGIAWGDYDNDGDLDGYIASHRSLLTPSALITNDGTGRFTVTSQLSGTLPLRSCSLDEHAAAWGDFDADGDLDLYIVHGANRGIFPKRNELLRNDGGTFHDVAEEAGVTDPTGRGRDANWVDYDQDGDLDLFVLNHKTPHRLFRNNGDGTFTDVADRVGLAFSGIAFSASWADYNNDGWPDLLILPNAGLFRNERGRAFTNVTEAAGLDLQSARTAAWGDYDNDGYPDLYLPYPSGGGALYRNAGDGSFTDVTREAGVEHALRAHAAAFGDYDQDGCLDLYIGTADAPNILFRNNCDGTFTDVTAETGTEGLTAPLTMALANVASFVSWADLNGDSYPELIVMHTLGPEGYDSLDPRCLLAGGRVYPPLFLFENRYGAPDR